MKNQIHHALILLVTTLLLAGCHKASDEEELRRTIAEYHQSLEAKNFELYMAFYSKRYFSSTDERYVGRIDEWKENLQQKVFDAYQKLTVRSTIKSMQRMPHNYKVLESMSITGIDSLGQEHTIWKHNNLLTTWAKNGDRWDIDNQRSLLIPSFYDSLTSHYEGRAQGGFLYVCHVTLDFVSVIDTKTNKVVGMIPCARGSDHIAFANENDVGFATSFDANSMRLFRKSTNERITDIPLGEQPSDVILDPGEDFVYVAHQSKDGLWVLSRRTHQVVKKLPTKTGPLYWSARERKIYQPQIFTPFVDVFDPARDFAFDRIEVGGRPLGLAFTPDERYAYVANYDLNEVEKIETSSKTVAKRISSIPHPRGICIDAEGHFAFITNVTSDKLTILDLSRDKVVDSLDTGRMPTDVVIEPAAHSVYVSNQGAGTISVFDIATHKLTQTIPVADNPISLRLDSGASSTKVSVK